jgi:hypothetical protein
MGCDQDRLMTGVRKNTSRRLALELLASSRDGCTKAIMIAHGFTVPQMVELVRAGLAIATPERVVAGGRSDFSDAARL